MYDSYMQQYYRPTPMFSNAQTLDLMRQMRDAQIQQQYQFNRPTRASDVQSLMGSWNNAMQTASAQGWQYPRYASDWGRSNFSMQAPQYMPNFTGGMGGDVGGGMTQRSPYNGHSFSPYSGMMGSPFRPYNNGDMSTQQGGVVGPYFGQDANGAVARLGAFGNMAFGGTGF